MQDEVTIWMVPAGYCGGSQGDETPIRMMRVIDVDSYIANKLKEARQEGLDLTPLGTTRWREQADD